MAQEGDLGTQWVAKTGHQLGKEVLYRVEGS